VAVLAISPVVLALIPALLALALGLSRPEKTPGIPNPINY
jgi:hypothetical protein